MDGRARSHRSCPRPGRYPDSRGCPASGRLGRPAGPAARVRAGRWLRAGEPRGPLARWPVRVRRRRHHRAVGDRRDRHARTGVGAGEEPPVVARSTDPRGAAVHELHLRFAGRRARPREPRQPRDHAHHRTLAHLGHRADPGGGRARPPGGPRAAAGGGTMRKAPVMLFAALLAHGCGGSGSRPPGSQAGAGKALAIAVIPKGTTHEFWKSIHAGAIQASRELSAQGAPINVIWKGPLREDDREQQIQVVEGFTSQGIQGIVLAPLDSRALVRPVEEARHAGVPTVIIDSDLESDAIVSFVATDNRKGGQLGADRLGQLDGIVVQNPMRMGYLGVKTMAEHLRGKPVERRIDTGVTLVTPANLDSAATQELIKPPIARYLIEQ